MQTHLHLPKKGLQPPAHAYPILQVFVKVKSFRGSLFNRNSFMQIKFRLCRVLAQATGGQKGRQLLREHVTSFAPLGIPVSRKFSHVEVEFGGPRQGPARSSYSNLGIDVKGRMLIARGRVQARAFGARLQPQNVVLQASASPVPPAEC